MTSDRTLYMAHNRGKPMKVNVRRLGVLIRVLPIAVGETQADAMREALQRQVHPVGPVHESTLAAIRLAVDQAEAEGIAIFQGIADDDGSPVWRLVPASIRMDDLIAKSMQPPQ